VVPSCCCVFHIYKDNLYFLLLLLCFYYTADTDNVPPFATVTLYLVPSGDLNIKPLAESSISISPPSTSNLEAGLVVPIPTLPPLGLSTKGYVALKFPLSVDCSQVLPDVLIPKSKTAEAFVELPILNLVPVLVVVPEVAGFEVDPAPRISKRVAGLVVPIPTLPASLVITNLVDFLQSYKYHLQLKPY